MDWLAQNWELCLAGFFILEKLVKLSPTKYDDILLDVVWDGFRKAIGKNRWSSIFIGNRI